MNFGLNHSLIQSLQEIFEDFPNIQKVVLYGSRAKGNFQYNSDIDLSLFGEISYNDLLKIEMKIDDLLLPYKVDLSVFNKIENIELKQHIERVGVIFYHRNCINEVI